MIITIVGGGNLSHVCAGFLAAQDGVEIRVLTRRPKDWSNELCITQPDGSVLHGHLALVTAEAGLALQDADIALLCLPGFSISSVLTQIAPHLSPTTAVGSVVSSTGFFFQAFDFLPKTQPLFGFQRVPFISRTEKYGHSAKLLGYKQSLSVAIEQCRDKETLRSTLATLFHCPVNLLENYYEASLSNSNPLLHTCRIFTMWADYKEDTIYPRVPQFYGEWTLEAAQLYIDMDRELQALLQALHVRACAVPDVLTYYECSNATELTRKISTIPAFQNLPTPMKKHGDGFIPDFNSRYFIEDFAYGLRFIYELAEKNNIHSPAITKVYKWGKSLIDKYGSDR